MLAIHWSPVKNTKRILKTGITKTKAGTHCFPTTGIWCLDRWWAQALRSWRPRTQYNGFVFRIVEGDLPACFSHWLTGTREKPIQTMAQLEGKVRETIFWRLGERFPKEGVLQNDEELLERGKEICRQTPGLFERTLCSDPEFLRFIFEDYQIVLSNSIAASRIIRVIPGGNESGRSFIRKKRSAVATGRFEAED